MDLSGRVALVTGGAMRAGRYFSLALAEAGADIVINHWHTPDEADYTKSEIESLHRQCITVGADISDVDQIRRLINEIKQKFGRLDILVHNASNFNKCNLGEITEEIWESSFGVNLKGPFFLSQAAADLMKKNDFGRIIAVVGNSYHENWPDFIPHCISKAGLVKMIQGLAVALTPTIQCNAICPDAFYPAEVKTYDGDKVLVKTDNYEEFRQDYIIKKGHEIVKGTPEKVAELIVYLSGCSNYLNGAVISLDGGKSIV